MLERPQSGDGYVSINQIPLPLTVFSPNGEDRDFMGDHSVAMKLVARLYPESSDQCLNVWMEIRDKWRPSRISTGIDALYDLYQ